MLWAIAPTFSGDDEDATATTRTGILVVGAATIAAVGAGLSLIETQRANREADQRERYSKAIDQLGHKRVDVRLGGIYMLERLASDPRGGDLRTVVEVLCAFVREHGQGPKSDGDGAPEKHQTPTDIQAALAVVSRVHHLKKVKDDEADPRRSHIDLRSAHLECALLEKASLQKASLTRANLTGANLRYAKLKGAYLGDAVLNGARLGGADLTGTETNAVGAYLVGAHLIGASLPAANLSNAILSGADLTGADLNGANLTGANVGGANMANARGLTQEQLEAAAGDEETLLPERFTRPSRWSSQSTATDAAAASHFDDAP